MFIKSGPRGAILPSRFHAANLKLLHFQIHKAADAFISRPASVKYTLSLSAHTSEFIIYKRAHYCVIYS